MSNSNSPQRQKPPNEDGETKGEENTDFLEHQNNTNMMEIMKRMDSQMINLTKDVVSIKNQIDDHIQNCSSESENMTEQNKTLKNLQTQLETVNMNQCNRFLKPRNWCVCEIIIIFLVLKIYLSFGGALVATTCLVLYCKEVWTSEHFMVGFLIIIITLSKIKPQDPKEI